MTYEQLEKENESTRSTVRGINSAVVTLMGEIESIEEKSEELKSNQDE